MPISLASMSTWMKCSARGAHSLSFAVTRSSTRIPTIIRTSAFWTALMFQPVPMKPVICSANGWRVGNAPTPSSVVPTGVPERSATSSSSCSARLRITPWPARMTGRLAWASNSMARSAVAGSGS